MTKTAVAIVLSICTLSIAEDSPPNNPLQALLGFGCDRDIRSEFHFAYHDFATRLHKATAKRYKDQFVLSPLSAWLVAAALAEGATGETQQLLFKELNLPSEECIRKKFYKFAKSLETPGDDINITRTSVLVEDEGVQINNTWANMVRDAGILDVQTVPFGKQDETVKKLGEYLGSSSVEFPNIDFSNNITSVVLDSLDLSTKWTFAFEESSIQRNMPYFDDSGKQIGTVDLLKAKRRVKLAYLPPPLNAKVLELPVGNNGRFRMLLLINNGKTSIWRTVELFPNTVVVDIFKFLRESVVPLEISIPCFHLATQTNHMKDIFEDLGVNSLWHLNEATQSISVPAAKPQTFVQRISFTLGKDGVSEPFNGALASYPSIQQIGELATGAASAVGRDFVGNRPMVFFLVDKDNNVILESGVISKP